MVMSQCRFIKCNKCTILMGDVDSQGGYACMGFPRGSVKHLPATWETWVQSLGWEDPLEKGEGCPLQYSGLENSMDCTIHGVAKGRTQLSDCHFDFHCHAPHTYRNLCCPVHEMHCLRILSRALWSTPLVLPPPFFPILLTLGSDLKLQTWPHLCWKHFWLVAYCLLN